jgi:hypothetical protein
MYTPPDASDSVGRYPVRARGRGSLAAFYNPRAAAGVSNIYVLRSSCRDRSRELVRRV